MIRFFVGGNPRAMRVTGVATFRKAGKVHMVPKRANTEWATLVGQIGREHAPPLPLDGALIFIARFYVVKPASLSRKASIGAMPVKRPDLDNLAHKLSDQFNGVFYHDDSQITDILVQKRYPFDGRTGVQIIVGPLTDAQLRAEIEQVVLDHDPAAV